MKFTITGIYDNKKTSVIWENGNIKYDNEFQEKETEILFIKYLGKSLWHESERFNHKANLFDSIKIIKEGFDKTEKIIVDESAKKYMDSYKIDELTGRETMSNKAEKSCSPGPGEDKTKFISRCIKEQMNKGKTQEEAKGMCYGIWSAKKSRDDLKKAIFAGINTVIKNIGK